MNDLEIFRTLVALFSKAGAGNMSIADATVSLSVNDPALLPRVPPGGRAPFSVFAHTGPCRGADGKDMTSPIFTLSPVAPGADRTVRGDHGEFSSVPGPA